MLYRTLRKVTSTNMRKNMYVVTPRSAAAAAVVSAVVLRRPTKEYTHPYSMMHRRLPTAGIEVAPHYHQLLVTGRTSIGQGAKNKKTKHFFSTRYVCVIQHRNWPLRFTILNAHSSNASPDGLCTRTHTNESFSCWFAVSRLELIEPGAATCV